MTIGDVGNGHLQLKGSGVALLDILPHLVVQVCDDSAVLQILISRLCFGCRHYVSLDERLFLYHLCHHAACQWLCNERILVLMSWNLKHFKQLRNNSMLAQVLRRGLFY